MVRNWKSAIYHLVRSGAQGSVEARAFLGSMYLKGYGIKRDLERAHLLLNESSRLGNPQGQRYLAEMYEKGADRFGLLTASTHEERLQAARDDRLRRQAKEEEEENSQENSQENSCGRKFEIVRDEFIALRLSEEAAGKGAEKLKAGLYSAQFVIEAATIAGRMYCLHSDFAGALAFFEQAAALGDLDAQCNLGHLLAVGAPGVEADGLTAATWLVLAANCGHRRAQKELAILYAHGFRDKESGELVLEQNVREAMLWFDAASKGGYIDCYVRLAEIYASGNNRYPGVPQNFKIARKYLEMAREEAGLSKSVKDKLPEGVWVRLLRDPLQTRTLIATFENAVGGLWRGSIGDLDPERLRKIVGVDHV